MLQNFAINNPEAPQLLLPNLFSSRSYGKHEEFPNCRDENQMLCLRLDSSRSWRGDFFSFSLCAIWPKHMHNFSMS